MRQTPKRFLGWLVHQRLPVCFACGKPAATACPGHEYGGTIIGYRLRRAFRYVPAWTWSWVDCRWSRP
jgi:hypothetical protein